MARARGPVGHTCPKIDAVISSVNSAINRCCQGDADSAADDLAEVEAKMEVIRDANDQLRDWGAEQEDLANSHAESISDLEKEISMLRDEIADLKRELDSALAESA